MKTTPLLLVAALMLLASCTEDPLYPGRHPQVRINYLPSLPSGFYYELWVSAPASSGKKTGTSHADNEFSSIGRFVVTLSGEALGLDGNAPMFFIPASIDPNLLTDAIVTIQQQGVDPSMPGRRLLSGDFVGTDIHAYDTLTMDGREAFDGPLSGNLGAFVLDAPTSEVGSDSARGIWFVRIERDPFTDQALDTLPGLTVRDLPISEENSGWTYQAWLVRTRAGESTEYIPLGRFLKGGAPDSDTAGPGAGAQPNIHYAAPGSDFVTGMARTLNDGTYGVVISMEPDNIDPVRPGVQLLSRDRIEADLPSRRTYDMTRPANGPSVTIYLDR